MLERKGGEEGKNRKNVIALQQLMGITAPPAGISYHQGLRWNLMSGSSVIFVSYSFTWCVCTWMMYRKKSGCVRSVKLLCEGKNNNLHKHNKVENVVVKMYINVKFLSYIFHHTHTYIHTFPISAYLCYLVLLSFLLFHRILLMLIWIWN